MDKPNVLLVTIDQLRADLISGPLADIVPTPNIDRLAAGGTLFENHYTVTAPCGPARASLLTGLYAMNHRSIRNGTPLARHHATIATEMRKAGYEPLLFGYTDATADPTDRDVEDPDFSTYEGIAPGFREIVEMRQESGLEWPSWLAARGHEIGDLTAKIPDLYCPIPTTGNAPAVNDPARYSAEESDTAYLTDRTIEALSLRANRPWFAHVTFVRPHPPLVAPTPYNAMFDPANLPPPDLRRTNHPFIDAWFSAASNTGLFWGFDGDCAAMDDETAARCRAVYCGLVAEVDHHIGRILDWLDETGQADRTLVIVTADHGEMLGDKKMWGKESVFEPAFRVPLIIRAPGTVAAGRRIAALTECIDVAPTILRHVGREAPPAFDGHALQTLMTGERDSLRQSVLMEIDFSHPERTTRFQRHFGLDANRCNAAILRDDRWKYVHLGGGVSPMLFDLEDDPGETENLADRPDQGERISAMRAALLDRLTERRDRRLTGFAFD